jgi:hypothetical protein
MTSSPDPYSNSGIFLSLWHLISGSRVKKDPENPISVVDGNQKA